MYSDHPCDVCTVMANNNDVYIDNTKLSYLVNQLPKFHTVYLLSCMISVYALTNLNLKIKFVSTSMQFLEISPCSYDLFVMSLYIYNNDT